MIRKPKLNWPPPMENSAIWSMAKQKSSIPNWSMPRRQKRWSWRSQQRLRSFDPGAMEFTDGFPQPLFKGLCADDLWTVSCCFRGGSNYTLQEGHRARTRADRASCRIRKGTGCVGRYRCGPPAMDKGDGTQTDLGHRSTLSGHGHAKVANPMKTDPKRFLYLRPPSTFRHPRNRSILPNNSRASNKEKRKSLQAPRASRSDRSERAPVRLNQGALASRLLYPQSAVSPS